MMFVSLIIETHEPALRKTVNAEHSLNGHCAEFGGADTAHG